MRTSASSSVIERHDLRERAQSLAAATGALSRIDHHTSVAAPGSSVASTMVRPLATARRVISPADRRTSACSPGRSIVARAAPACGTGRMNDAAARAEDERPAPFGVDRKRPGPGDQGVERLTVGDQRHRPAAGVASTSVAPLISGTRLTPLCSTWPERVNDAARRFAIDGDLEIGARHDGGDRRRGRSRRRARREIEQPVVFGQGHRHRSRLIDRPHRRLRATFAARAIERTSVVKSDSLVMMHLLDLGGSRDRSTASVIRPSARTAMKSDGPMVGNVTSTGSAPDTVRPPPSLR